MSTCRIRFYFVIFKHLFLLICLPASSPPSAWTAPKMCLSNHPWPPFLSCVFLPPAPSSLFFLTHGLASNFITYTSCLPRSQHPYKRAKLGSLVIQHIGTLSFWTTSQNWMLSSFIDFPVNFLSFFFTAEHNSVVYMCHVFTIIHVLISTEAGSIVSMDVYLSLWQDSVLWAHAPEELCSVLFSITQEVSLLISV